MMLIICIQRKDPQRNGFSLTPVFFTTRRTDWQVPSHRSFVILINWLMFLCMKKINLCVCACARMLSVFLLFVVFSWFSGAFPVHLRSSANNDNFTSTFTLFHTLNYLLFVIVLMRSLDLILSLMVIADILVFSCVSSLLINQST